MRNACAVQVDTEHSPALATAQSLWPDLLAALRATLSVTTRAATAARQQLRAAADHGAKARKASEAAEREAARASGERCNAQLRAAELQVRCCYLRRAARRCGKVQDTKQNYGRAQACTVIRNGAGGGIREGRSFCAAR